MAVRRRRDCDDGSSSLTAPAFKQWWGVRDDEWSHDLVFLWLLDASHWMVLTADGSRYAENFCTYTAASKMIGRTACHDDVTEVVSFAAPLKRTVRGNLIRQCREETWRKRKEPGPSYDDGWVRCIDWDGPARGGRGGLARAYSTVSAGEARAPDRDTEYDEDVDTVIGPR